MYEVVRVRETMDEGALGAAAVGRPRQGNIVAQNADVICCLDILRFHESTDVAIVEAGLCGPSSIRSLSLHYC